MKTVDPGSRLSRWSSTTDELDPHEEDSDAHGGDDGGASALSAAGRTGDRAEDLDGAATGQSGRDKGCAGGRGDELLELTERPEVQIRELLHCSICLYFGLLLAMLCQLYRLVLNCKNVLP